MANPISKTAYYTLGVRAWDAAKPHPLCGDSYAKRFMNEEAEHIWQLFKDDSRPNASNAGRHAIIDNFLRADLSNQRDALVIIVGAGFDTRAFRINGGHWIEIDEPAIISYKESVLPSAEATNTLRRIPIEFSRESLKEKLLAFATERKTYVVVEGVLMYINHSQRSDLLLTLQQLFPRHTVYCDLMRKSFFDRYSKQIHDKILTLGATFTDITENSENIFLDKGYSALSHTSIPLFAARYGGLDIPYFVVRYFLKTLRNGYSIWAFEYSK